MRVVFATYPWAYDVPGGGERQMQFYQTALQRQSDRWPTLKLDSFNMMNPRFGEMRLLHYFSCMPSSKDFLEYVKRKGIPLIVSPNFWPDPEGWGTSGVIENIKTILWLANKVIVNSFIEEEALVRLCKIDSSYISVVHNAVEDVFFKAVSPNLFRNAFALDGAFILNIANVEPRKNQLAFLKALKSFPNLKLVTIGGVRDKYYLDACKAEGQGQFLLVDPLPPCSELMRSAMNACEFFAMPSLRETPSIASLEAGATGSKLLTTELGSTTEYFGEHATYVNPYDIHNMRAAVHSLLKQSKTNTLRDRIHKHYRWDVVIEKLIECYSEVLDQELRV